MQETIGERIKLIRQNMGLSQKKFAELINAPKSSVGNWEANLNRPNNERLKAIAELGDLTVEELLHGKTKWQQYDEELLAKDPNAFSKISSSIDKYEGFVAFLSSLGYEVSSNDEITIISKDNQQYELTTDEYMKLQQDIENFTNYNISNLK